MSEWRAGASLTRVRGLPGMGPPARPIRQLWEHHGRRGLARLGDVPTNVVHSRRTLLAVPLDPPVRGPPGDVAELCCPGRGPSLLHGQPRQAEPLCRGVKALVWAEKVFLGERFLDSSTPHREAFTQLRARRTRSRNVPGLTLGKPSDLSLVDSLVES
jgi:hypothetical protein